MTRTDTLDIWLCSDCGVLTANGTSGWGTDDNGIELGELHLERMRAYSPDADMVVSGCPEGEHCDFLYRPEHTCRYDRDFSSAQCDGCGTHDAGFRFAAVEFVRP